MATSLTSVVTNERRPESKVRMTGCRQVLLPRVKAPLFGGAPVPGACGPHSHVNGAAMSA